MTAKARHPELRDTVAVVTGAAKGIGRGIALRLGAEGMHIVAADIDAAATASLVAELIELGAEAIPHAADMGDQGQIDAVFDATMRAYGRVDLLVNNAADLERTRFLDAHDELLERQMAVNVLGPYLASQRAAAVMRDAGSGSIVHISSVGGVRAHHQAFPYDVTKGAINTLTMAMAVDLSEYGIRVNAVAPGAIHTHRTTNIDDAYRARDRRIPLGRHGTPVDIAGAVAFLASDDAAYITGQVLYVDGGITAQLSPRGQNI